MPVLRLVFTRPRHVQFDNPVRFVRAMTLCVRIGLCCSICFAGLSGFGFGRTQTRMSIVCHVLTFRHNIAGTPIYWPSRIIFTFRPINDASRTHRGHHNIPAYYITDARCMATNANVYRQVDTQWVTFKNSVGWHSPLRFLAADKTLCVRSRAHARPIQNAVE